MKAALAGDDMAAEDVQALMASADTDGDGLLEEEFVRLLVQETEAGQEDDGERCERLREALGMYVMEGRGRMHHAAKPEADDGQAGHALDIQECQFIIFRFDLNGDGLLTFDDFKTMMMA